MIRPTIRPRFIRSATATASEALRPIFRLPALVVWCIQAMVLFASSAEEAKKVTFQDHALPVLRQRCGSCHNADKKTAGLDVTTYAGIMAGGGSGEVIVPGDAAGSHLFRVVNHDDEPKMPPDAPPIPEAERQSLKAWIDGGVLEHGGSQAVKAKKVDVAMTGSATERPAVRPMPAHLPLEPLLRTPAVDACASIASSPWSPLVAVCGQKQILIYRTDSLDLAGTLPFPEGRPHVVRFSRGGGLVLAAGGVGATSGRVAVWNLKNGRRIRTLGEELDVVLAADVSPDQRLVALGGPQRMVRVYSLETGEKRFEMKKHTDWIQSAAFSPDGALLATSDRSGGVVVWEAATGRDFLVLNGHPASVTTLAWRGDSNMLATGCEDGQIRLWELENGTQVKAWAAHGGGVASVTFTRDGRLASVGRDRVPKLWKPDGTQERAFEAQPDLGLAVAFCDETGRLVAGDWTGQISVWNAADGAKLGSLDQNPPTLAERVAAVDRSLTEAKSALAEAEKAAAAAAAKSQSSVSEQAAAAAARQAAELSLAERQKRVDSLVAAIEAAKQANADAAASADLQKQHAAAVPERDQAKASLDATVMKLQQADAAVAAARGEQQKVAAQLVEHQVRTAGVAAAHARWLAEIAFQGQYTLLAAALADRERELAGAEAAVAEAEAKKRAEEDVRRGHESARDAAKQKADTLAAMIAGLQRESQELAGKIAARGGEITAVQQRIEQLVQAIAAVDEAAKSLAKGLAAAPGDAELAAAQNALGAARPAKQAQLDGKQKEIVALTAERTAWEKLLGEKKALADRHVQEMAAATAEMNEAAKRIEATAPAVAAAAKEVETRQAAVTERRKQSDAASAALDALQGVGG
ncbi:MAG: c-type cytochrome domain-containing protein [Planctomycetia bacterium]